MSDEIFGRIENDLAVMKKAMGLHVAFGKEVLVFGLLMSLAALGSTAFSLLVVDDRLQIIPFVAISVICTIGAYVQSWRSKSVSSETTIQIMLSLVIYVVVSVAEFGYVVIAFAGQSVGILRTTVLYATSIGLLVAFAVILVRTALLNRERYYCLGLAVSPLVAGMLLPILEFRYCYPMAHCVMAIGYLVAVAIQWVQLREMVSSNATN